MAGLTWATGGVATTEETVFTELTGTFTFNDDDLSAVYIDWGDGTDPDGDFTNKKEYANYQWYETTEATGSVAVTHTYTATGTFDPVIQVVNSEGFFSHYTASGASNTELSPYSQTQGTMTSMGIVDGTAVGVMRSQNKTVKSGIDNSVFFGMGKNNQGRDLYLQVAPTLTAVELAYIDRLEIDVECVLNQTMTDYTSTEDLLTGAQLGGDPVNKTLTVIVSGANLFPEIGGGSPGKDATLNILASGNNGAPLVTGATVQRVNKITFKNPKYTGSSLNSYTENEVYNRLKVFFVVQTADIDADEFIPIAYITPGAPIKKADDPLRNVILDFSQSRAKASNISISDYRYDTGTGWFTLNDMWEVGERDTTPPIYPQRNRFTDITLTPESTKKIGYTYRCNPKGLSTASYTSHTLFVKSSYWQYNLEGAKVVDQLLLDDYGRFADQYQLARVTAQPSSTVPYEYAAPMYWTGSGISTVADSVIPVFRVTPGVEWPSGSDTGAVTYPTKLLDNGSPDDLTNDTSYSEDFSVQAQNNASGATAGSVKLNAINSMDFKAIDNSTSRNSNEYLLLLLPAKTNQLYFNITNYAQNLQSALGTQPDYGIAGVSYLQIEQSGTLHQDVNWVPLEFEDTTAHSREYRDTDAADKKYTQIKASLAKSGIISFSEPTAWQPISLNTLCGGNFSQAYTTVGAADVVISGTIEGTPAGGSKIGEYVQLRPNSAGTTTMDQRGLTKKKVGSMKYIFTCTDSDNAALIGSAYWLSKDGEDGWDGNVAFDDIYLHLGNTSSVTSPADEDTLTGSIRRINIYDAITGFSKVYKDSASTTKLPMVDASGTTAVEATRYPYDFSLLTTANSLGENTVGGRMEDEWGSTDVYPIRISLSGTVGTGATEAYPEIWNIFNPNAGNSVVIREIDDSAYNLNSVAIVSDISMTRAGNYYQAITRKGKVFIARVGTPIQQVGFSSVALGDENDADAFSDHGPSTLYGHLHMIRKIQADSVRVYWDEPQKDGTFIRIWGIINNVSESAGTGGPRRIVSYSFNMIVEEIALLDANYKLMTDVFPLGGVVDGKNFS